MNKEMRLVLAADHKGYDIKEKIKVWLQKEKIVFSDIGCFSEESCDYPDYALPAAEKVLQD